MVQLITALITLICILLVLASFAGAFYFAKKHISYQHRINILEDSYKEATEYISRQEEAILQLKSELDFIHREDESRSARNERPRTWNPNNLMETGNRHQ